MRAARCQQHAGERYIAGRERLTQGQCTRLIAEVAGVPPSKTLPGPVAMAMAQLLTRFAALTRRPPLWDMSVDALAHGQGRTLCGREQG